jgi:hypothetical protein
VQAQHPKAITIEHVAWTPSAATAALIAEDISHRLAARAMHAGWYHLDVADAIAAVRKATRLFPSSRIVEHEALMAQLTDLTRVTRAARRAPVGIKASALERAWLSTVTSSTAPHTTCSPR